jgi:signal transduction histidine kinase
MFASVVVLAVGTVAWLVSVRTRHAFERVDQQRTEALVAQFRSGFQREGDQVIRSLERLSTAERMQRLAFDVKHGDPSLYVQEASTLAQGYQLDFLELLSPDGTIISSAQYPARFGYKEQLPQSFSSAFYLKRIELPDGTALGLMAARSLRTGDSTLYLIGGKRLDREFIQNFSAPAGTYLWLYRFTQPTLSGDDLLGVPAPLDSLAALIHAAQSGSEVSGLAQLSAAKFDRATLQAIPLKDDAGGVAAVLLAGTSRRPLLELQQQIRAAAFSVAGLGILLAIAATLWIAAYFSRPIEQLVRASRQIAEGQWDVQVAAKSKDEIGELAESFNTMARDLCNQRDRLLQAERVAAWRELARRLAHELKNPLFPLQITVENLIRARELAPSEFDEVFRESTSTLLDEISNLKTIIGRFSDFSKMPKPQLQQANLNELVARIASLHQPQLSAAAKPIELDLDLAPVPEIALDPDLIHRVLSNLILNAVDAMPDGGTITIRTAKEEAFVRLDVGDTGVGLTPEESERLFTPYYTSKQHGTGLGLAIVQSVISDHRGRISVESEAGRGTKFIIHLPKNADPAHYSSSREGNHDDYVQGGHSHRR